jgi:Flp pilus assembly pilin Flp
MNILATTARKWLSISDERQLDGQSLVEYSLIILLVVVACVAVVTAMGGVVYDTLWSQASQLPF